MKYYSNFKHPISMRAVFTFSNIVSEFKSILDDLNLICASITRVFQLNVPFYKLNFWENIIQILFVISEIDFQFVIRATFSCVMLFLIIINKYIIIIHYFQLRKINKRLDASNPIRIIVRTGYRVQVILS